MIGIDLGNEHCIIACIGQQGPVTLTADDGSYFIPSVVAVDDDGRTLCGREAQSYLLDHPENGEANFVNELGNDVTYQFGGRQWTPTDCIQQLLHHLAQQAKNYLGKDSDACVIAVPAYYHDGQRRSLFDAARNNNIKISSLINEPAAIALRFWYDDANEAKTLMVLDFGEQKFDVSILAVHKNGFEILATHGLEKVDYQQSSTDNFQSMKASCDIALKDSSLNSQQIDDILCVGSIQAFTDYRDLFNDEFAWVCKTLAQADQTVAQGAAIYATMHRSMPKVTSEASSSGGCASIILCGITTLCFCICLWLT